MYNVVLSSTVDSETVATLFGGLLGSIIGFVWIIGIAISVFSLICMWKCFVKMGEPGWTALIPFYNTWHLCQHTWGNGLIMLTWLIPVMGQFMTMFTYWKLFKGFGKTTIFCICGLLFTPIMLAICAFDDSTFTDQIEE